MGGDENDPESTGRGLTHGSIPTEVRTQSHQSGYFFIFNHTIIESDSDQTRN